MQGDPYAGVSRMVGFVEELGRNSGIECPMQMTLGIADGERFQEIPESTFLTIDAGNVETREFVPTTP